MATRKRKQRPITSCIECYRRKQKCDRGLPCATCVARGVPEKCSFTPVADPGLAFDDVSRVTNDHSPKRPRLELDQTNGSTTQSSDLREQTGYSLTFENNFTMLQKSSQDKENTEFAEQDSNTKVPHFVRLQIAEIETQLPSESIQLELVDIFFTRSPWWSSSLEPQAFRSMLSTWYNLDRKKSGQNRGSTTSHEIKYFSALLFQVLAIAIQYLPVDSTEIWKELHIYDQNSADVLSNRYSKSGMQIVELLGRQSSAVTAVQHDMVRGMWLKNVSRGKESWHSLGNAIRQAQELGLHLNKTQPSSLDSAALNRWLWQDMLNKRVWAILFGWDAHVAFTLGRPRIINASDCDNMQLLTCSVPADTSASAPEQALTDPGPSPIEPVVFAYRIGYIIHKMIDQGANKPSLKQYDILQSLEADLNNIWAETSPFFRYHDPDTSRDAEIPSIPKMRLHLATVASTYLVALNRAHVLRYQQSLEVAISAAMTTLTAQSKLFNLIDPQTWRIYTYSFFTIDAAIFLGALMLEQPDLLPYPQFCDVMDAVQQALTRLEQMSGASPMAKTGAQLLRRCCSRINEKLLPAKQVHNGIIPASPLFNGSGENFKSDKTQTFVDLSIPDSMYPSSPSLRSWIEQMDQVMLPILEADPNQPFDNALWDMLLEN